MKKIYLFFLLIIPLAGNAQNDTIPSVDILELPEAEVVAPIRATEVTPVPHTDISAKEIDRLNFGQEPAFILSSTPSVISFSDAGSYSGYSYFRLRGIDQTRINMTLDGIPLNEPEDQGVYFSNFPDFFNSARSIQVQRGVGVSTAGVASYGGSVNFESPTLFGKEKIEVGANYGSFNSYRSYAEYQSGYKKQFGVYARGSYLSSDGYKYRSGHKGGSGFLSFGWNKINHIVKVTGFLGHSKNQMAWLGVPETEIEADPKTNFNSEEDDAFTQGLVAVTHDGDLGGGKRLTTSVFYNHLNGNYDFDLDNFLGFPSTGEMFNYAFKSHFTGVLSHFSLEKDKYDFRAGIHGQHYRREHLGSQSSFGELYTNTGFRNELSAYVKTTYRIEKFNLFGDLQLRWNNFKYEGAVPMDDLSWLFLNPRIGASYGLNSKTVFYYSIGLTGREPTRNDLFFGNDDLVTDIEGNPLVGSDTPERVIDNELGVKFNKDKLSFDGNLFYMIFNNEITLNGEFGPNGLALNSSVAKSFRSGLETDFRYMFDFGLGLRNNMSFMYSRITEEDVSFQPIMTPNVIINQGFDYRYKGLTVGLDMRFQGKSYIDFANEVELPAYFNMNFMASYRYKFAELTLRLNNLTNDTYYTNGQFDIYGTPTYQIQAPLNYNVGLRLMW